MTEESKQPNDFGKAMQEWWDSDACKQLKRQIKKHKNVQ